MSDDIQNIDSPRDDVEIQEIEIDDIQDNIPETPRENPAEGTEDQNNAITLKELIEKQRKKEEIFFIDLINPLFAKKITTQKEEEKRSLEPKYQVDRGEKYGRLRVGEVFRTAFHSTHHFRGNTLPNHAVLPYPSTSVVESIVLPSDESKNRMIGNAYCSHTTQYSAVYTKVYPTHRIVVIADPFHVAGGEVSAEQLCATFYKSYETHFKMISSYISTIESMVEVLTDLDLIFSKNHLVPVNTAILVISNEDGGFNTSKPTILSTVLGGMHLFKMKRNGEIVKLNSSSNYRIGDSKGDEIEMHFDWSSYEKDDMIVVMTEEELGEGVDPVDAVRAKIGDGCVFDAIMKKCNQVAVGFTLNVDLWHAQSFMGRPKKDWMKPVMVKV